MRAVLVNPSSPVGIELGTTADPTPSPRQALVRVAAFSLVARSTRYARTLPPGAVPGLDAAGIVAREAADGSGPAAGTRVVTLATGGAWGELRAVAEEDLAVVPPEVDLGRASAMAVPAVSALRALRRFGSLLGRRVLVTGASGAVGWFAVQLGRLAGAEVIASVRSEARGKGLRELGAAQVVTDLSQVRRKVAGVIDTVGGRQLVESFQLLEEGGSVQTVGSSSNEPATFPPYSTVGARRSLEAFWSGDKFGADLTYLLSLAADGRLALIDGDRHEWTEIERVGAQLAESAATARAILSVG